MPIHLYFFIAAGIIALIYMITGFIYTFAIDDRNQKKFRADLKIGDYTDTGKVTNIDGNIITIERNTTIDNIYPSKINKGRFPFLYMR